MVIILQKNMKKYYLKILLIILFFAFFSVFFNAFGAEKLFYNIRLSYDKDKNFIKIDDEVLLGSVIDISSKTCDVDYPEKMLYYARVVSLGNKLLLDKYNIGKIETKIFKDILDPKTGRIVSGGLEIVRKGTINICIPYFNNGKLIEIYNAESNQLILSANVSVFSSAKESALPNNQPVVVSSSSSSDQNNSQGFFGGTFKIIVVIFVIIIIFCIIKIWKTNKNH